MRRYNITAGIDQHGAPPGLGVPRIRINEEFNGEWVRYEDVCRFSLLLARMVALWRNPSLGSIDENLIEQIEEVINK